jgi:cytochrome oxidase Cu insertion factor (SCO1/SenC/PrrC family)
MFWVLFVMTIGSYPLIHSLTHPLPEPLPAIAVVDPFELKNLKGEPYGMKDLRDLMWVVNMVCTECTDGDAEYGKALFKIQHRSRGVGKRFRAVSITRKPETDDADKLQAYASSLRYSPRMWSFLHGPKDDVEAVITNIFDNQAVRQKVPGTKPEIPLMYRTALVDVNGQIRGYYDVRFPEELERLLLDMRMVINRGY